MLQFLRMNRHILVGLVAFAVQLVPVVAAEREPAIERVAASVRDGRVYLDLEAVNTLDANAIERLGSGLPVTLEYEVEVFTRRRAWFDNTRNSAGIRLETIYDAVTREYTVTRRLDGQLFDVTSFRSLNELEPRLARLNDFPVLQVADAPLGEDPVLRVRVVTRRRSWLWIIPRVVASEWSTTTLALDVGRGPASGETQ